MSCEQRWVACYLQGHVDSKGLQSFCVYMYVSAVPVASWQEGLDRYEMFVAQVSHELLKS